MELTDSERRPVDPKPEQDLEEGCRLCGATYKEHLPVAGQHGEAWMLCPTGVFTPLRLRYKRDPKRG